MGDSEQSPLLKGSSKTVQKPNDEHNATNYGTNGSAPDEVSNVKSDAETQEEDRNEPLYNGIPEVKAKLKWIIPSIGVGIFLAAADQTIIVACYGKIGSDLNSLSNTSWIAAAYYLTLTSIQPLSVIQLAANKVESIVANLGQIRQNERHLWEKIVSTIRLRNFRSRMPILWIG